MGELADLKLDDIDWLHGTFTVDGKSRNEGRLPLPQDFGDAMLSYLQRTRPRVSSSHVFITVLALGADYQGCRKKHVTARANGRVAGNG